MDFGRSASGNQRLVVGDDPGADGSADPGSILRGEAGGNLFERGCVDAGQHALFLQRGDGRALFGEEEVGRRVRALFGDLAGQLGRFGVADLDLDAGGLGEGGDEGLGRVAVLAVVEREGLGGAGAGGGEGGGGNCCCQQGSALEDHGGLL